MGEGKMKELIIYSSPTCGKCKMLKSWCDKNSISYHTVDITEDSKAHAKLLAEGKVNLPVIELDNELTCGDVKGLSEYIKSKM